MARLRMSIINVASIPCIPSYFLTYLESPLQIKGLEVEAKSHLLDAMSTEMWESDAEKFRGMARLLALKYTEAIGTQL